MIGWSLLKKHIFRAFAALIHLVTLGRLRHSRPTEGNALTMTLGDKLWWGYKFYGHPILEPQKDKGIREYFREHPITGFAAPSPEGQKDAGAKAAVPGPEGLADAAPSDARPSDARPSGAQPSSPRPDDGQPDDARPSTSHPNNAQSTASQPPDQAVITFGGDVLPAQSLGTMSTRHLWDQVSDFFFEADFRCANLESPVVRSLPLSCPTEDITTPPGLNNAAAAVALLAQEGAGINVFSTANNHALDQGVEGLLATLDFLDEAGLTHVGTARTALERDAFPLLEAGGIKVAFLSWTFSLNGHSLPEGREYLANVVRLNVPDIPLDPIVRQARHARQRGADVVVLFAHWGLEHEVFPLACQMETGHRLVEAGVDIIAGNHPHAPQPAERYCYRDAAGRQRDGLVLYALGDLVTQFPEVGVSALGALARVRLVRQPDSQVAICSAELKPVYAYRYPAAGTPPTDMRALDFATLRQRLQKGDLDSDPVLSLDQVKAIQKLIPVQEDVLPITC